VIFYNEQVARRLTEILEDDLKRSTPLSREKIESRSWGGRFVGLMMNPLTDQF
jgi:hypothetical protein